MLHRKAAHLRRGNLKETRGSSLAILAKSSCELDQLVAAAPTGLTVTHRSGQREAPWSMTVLQLRYNGDFGEMMYLLDLRYYNWCIFKQRVVHLPASRSSQIFLFAKVLVAYRSLPRHI